jgi:hypothetical protein
VRFLDALRINPSFTEGVRRYGFRKWYERELLFSHLYLVLALLALAGMLGAIEVFSGATLILKLIDVAFVLICGAVVFVSVQGYLWSLASAESIANQATCSQCNAYGRIEALYKEERDSAIVVRCKKCEHTWQIEID